MSLSIANKFLYEGSGLDRHHDWCMSISYFTEHTVTSYQNCKFIQNDDMCFNIVLCGNLYILEVYIMNSIIKYKTHIIKNINILKKLLNFPGSRIESMGLCQKFRKMESGFSFNI